jgi:hypothetical protein
MTALGRLNTIISDAERLKAWLREWEEEGKQLGNSGVHKELHEAVQHLTTARLWLHHALLGLGEKR